jgi:Skp family chaperone for outer membrane proteins
LKLKILLCSLLLSNLCFAIDSSIVYINETKVLKNSNVFKNEQQKIDANYKQKLNDLIAKQKSLTTQMKNATPAKKDAIALQMSQLQDEFAKLNDDKNARTKLVRNNYAETEESVVVTLRKEKGYRYVIDSGYVWAADPALEISDQVIKLTDAAYKKKFK